MLFRVGLPGLARLKDDHANVDTRTVNGRKSCADGDVADIADHLKNVQSAVVRMSRQCRLIIIFLIPH